MKDNPEWLVDLAFADFAREWLRTALEAGTVRFRVDGPSRRFVGDFHKWWPNLREAWEWSYTAAATDPAAEALCLDLFPAAAFLLMASFHIDELALWSRRIRTVSERSGRTQYRDWALLADAVVRLVQGRPQSLQSLTTITHPVFRLDAHAKYALYRLRQKKQDINEELREWISELRHEQSVEETRCLVLLATANFRDYPSDVSEQLLTEVAARLIGEVGMEHSDIAVAIAAVIVEYEKRQSPDVPLLYRNLLGFNSRLHGLVTDASVGGRVDDVSPAPFYEQALQLAETTDHRDVPPMPHALAVLINLCTAERRFNEAYSLAAWRFRYHEALGTPHIRALKEFAQVCNTVGKYERSQELYHQALGFATKSGLHDIELAWLFDGLAFSCAHLGRSDEAKQHYAQARDLYVSLLGREHPMTRRVIEALEALG